MSNPEETSSLKYIIHEDLYRIDESELIQSETAEEQEVEVKTESKSEVELKVENTPDPTPEPEPTIASEPEVPYVKRTSDILIVFDNPEGDGLPEAQQAYLEKILGAIKLQLSAVDMLNCSKQDAVETTGYQKVISFTDKYSATTASKYSVAVNENIKSLLVDDLTTISESTDLRKQLWGALQQMFPA